MEERRMSVRGSVCERELRDQMYSDAQHKTEACWKIFKAVKTNVPRREEGERERAHMQRG